MTITTNPSPNGAPLAPSAPEPLLLPAMEAARLCGVSRACWDRWTAGGVNPAPRRIGLGRGRPLWSIEELRKWIAAGCPARKEWEARQAAGRKGGGA